MAWQEDFINKTNNNTYLKLDDEIKKQIFNLMNDYSNDNYNQAKNIYINYSRNLINKLITDNLNIQNKISQKQKELSNLKDEYQKLENSNDIEIPPKNLETDKILKENNIKNIPLYKCLEFKEHISEEIKNNIEAALLDLNILDAKIIH